MSSGRSSNRHFPGGASTQGDESTAVERTGFRRSDLVKPAGIENTLGPSPSFSILSGPKGLFETLQSASEHPKKRHGFKTDVLGAFYGRWRKEVGPDLYPMIRLLLPVRDTRRSNFGLKEKKLAAAFVKAMQLRDTSDDAIKLTGWRVPTIDKTNAGDFSVIAYDVLVRRPNVVHTNVTIDEVNTALDELSSVFMTRDLSKEDKAKAGKPAELAADIIKKLYQHKMNALDLKWFIRIVLKDLKIGAGDRTVLDPIHPDAIELFNMCSDITRVCYMLVDPEYRLPHDNTTVRPGQVFKPMLSARNTSDFKDIIKRMGQFRLAVEEGEEMTLYPDDPDRFGLREFIIEEKLDGVRLQMHKSGDTYKYFSRKAIDFTRNYGASPQSGSFTPFVHHLFHPSIEECILDGEMLVWDPARNNYIPFGTLQTFTSNEHVPDQWEPRICFKIFDILYVKGKLDEGQSLLTSTLANRKMLLRKIFTPEPGRMELVLAMKGKDAKDISRELNRVMDERGEGLVIKNPDSRYMLAGRDTTWIKVKPDYMDELGENLDVVVIGAYWGEGKRGSRHGSYLCGLRDGDKIVNGQPVFVTVTKCGTGLNMATFKQIDDLTRGKWKDTKRKPTVLPEWMVSYGETPDQYINPTDSFVITVKAAEIVPSVSYGARACLRFPRAIRIREELNWESSLSLDGFLQNQLVRNVQGTTTMTNTKLKRRVARTTGPLTMSPPLPRITRISRIFDKYMFYVHYLKTDLIDKSAVERLIVEHGGVFIQRIVRQDEGEYKGRIVVATDDKGSLCMKKDAKTATWVVPEWVIDSAKAGKILPLTKQYVIQPSRALSKDPVYRSSPECVEPDTDMAGQPPAAQQAVIPGAAIIDDDDDDLIEPKTEGSDDGDSSGADDGGNEIDTGVYHPTDDKAFSERTRSIKEEVEEIEDTPMLRIDDDDNRMEIDDEGREQSDTLRSLEQTLIQVDPYALSTAQPGLGAGHGALDYDPEIIFDRLVFYLDLNDNVSKNHLPHAMTLSYVIQDEADANLKAVGTLLKSHGGVITDKLDHPGLTHIIISSEVTTRFVAMRLRTQLPRARKIVRFEWVHACVKEGQAIDEREYMAF